MMEMHKIRHVALLFFISHVGANESKKLYQVFDWLIHLQRERERGRHPDRKG
jgi:hypothetical protein